MKPSPLSFKTVPTLFELKQGFPALKGLFFDMDGTLFNTESHHAEAMLMIGAKYNIRPPHSAETIHQLMMGKADHLVFEIIKDWEGFPKDWTVTNFVDEKNTNLIKILSQVDPASYFPSETLSLLREAEKAKLYLALVTSSEKIITQELLKISKLTDLFHLILTRDDCLKHKPDPLPYHMALTESGLDKSEVVIFEDSHVGLTAALASGSHVIKVEWF
jgi:HAD superfamily hydrolase (TIGR01509 family)